MGRPNARIWPLPPRSVPEDWAAWLPADKEEVFSGVMHDLEALYSMLSISLNEAFTLRRENSLPHARSQVAIAAELTGRLSWRVGVILNAIETHARHFGTLPNVVPLNPRNFRGEAAQRQSRTSALLGRVLLSSRSRFFHKVSALGDMISSVSAKLRANSEELADGSSVQPGSQWGELEVLHYDLNSCLRETMIIFKSFLCALPNSELKMFRAKFDTDKGSHSKEAAPSSLRGGRAGSF